MTPTPLARLSLLLSPPLVMLGWALMRLLGTDGREPGWTLAHLAWLAGYVLLAVACVYLYRLTVTGGAPGRRSLAASFLAVALFGSLCMNTQMAIDLVAGFATSTVEAKNAFTDDIQALPGVELLVYQLGPALLFCALSAQTIHAYLARRLPVSVPVLVGLAVLVMVVDRLVDTPFRLTMGVASVLLWIAFTTVVKTRPATSASPVDVQRVA
ncbi:hypothetical protein [Stackebrandtia nassauensis]|uniref:Uncharacterized protein n=1 Tax=Stackebrandtia nassauensis (strain DSM 44728 / CIP 108903 / NRRL B-16338 / NBRC 102104 / LLR-40K-21) TaxID=446470 RepID=D3Q506_STANL|nr:hypothetical protein [Stackebrandtia nassauensis]ADD42186.1 hypothetical protein Snas_2504 [Stackebrandtia nassauensis DSM 44728]